MPTYDIHKFLNRTDSTTRSFFQVGPEEDMHVVESWTSSDLVGVSSFFPLLTRRFLTFSTKYIMYSILMEKRFKLNYFFGGIHFFQRVIFLQAKKTQVWEFGNS